MPVGSATSAPLTAAPTGSLARARWDPHYLRTALAISATAYLGFWFTYFEPGLRGTYPAVAPAVHVHGWTFFAWYLLFPLQAALIRARRTPWHRTLGRLSVVLAALMTLTGLVVGARMDDAVTTSQDAFWSASGLMIFVTLALFAGFYVAALLRRQQAAVHKRWLIVASAAGLGAATFRLIFVAVGPVTWAVPGGVLVTNLFIVWGMVHDRLREGRVHPAYRTGLVVCVGVELAAWVVTPTPVGVALARGLAFMGRTLALLY
jgi:hypothetical protein